MALTAGQQAEVARLKRLLGGALGGYTDEQLWELISSGESQYDIASRIWGEYAASTATLVDVAEGSSRRQLGDLYDQAQKMSAYFSQMAAGEADGAVGTTRTYRIRRS